MSREHDYAVSRSPLPPPPPPPPHHPPAAISPGLSGPTLTPQTSPLRRIAVQPPIITTCLAPPQGTSFLHTPVSATALNVPYSPYVPSPSTYAASPVSSPIAMRSQSSVPYNPQQWGRQGLGGGTYAPHSMNQTPVVTTRQLEITGMEASMPSPPPPYSPGQDHTPPSEYIPSRSASGFVRSRPGSMLVPQSATSVTSNPQFPPPPPRNPGERSASRDKSHSKFSLSAFRNRNVDSSPTPSAIDSLRINTTDAISRAPASPGVPPTRMSQA